MNNIENFYDQRGQEALKSPTPPQVPLVHAAPYRELYRILREKRASTNGPLNFLEVGCGTGLHLLEAARMGYSTTGIDLSPQSLKACERFANNENLTVQLHKGSFDLPEVAQQKFDVILTSGTLYYLDLSQFKLFVLSHLKPRGLFCCVETMGDNKILNIYRQWKNKKQGHRDETTLKNLLHQQDFKNFGQGFNSYDLQYFGLTSLLTKAFGKSRGLQKASLEVCEPIDDFLLNKLGSYSLAFKVLARYQL